MVGGGKSKWRLWYGNLTTLLNSSSVAASHVSSGDGRFAGQYPALEHFCCLKGEAHGAETILRFWFRGRSQKRQLVSTEGPSRNLGLACRGECRSEAQKVRAIICSGVAKNSGFLQNWK